MRYQQGFTVAELMLVVLLFIVLLGPFLQTLVQTDTYVNQGYGKITEQQEARVAMDFITRELAKTNPHWGITIANNYIQFYTPEFDAQGNYSGKHWFGFRLHPTQPKLLVKKEWGDADYIPIANNVESISFYGSSDCVNFNSTSVSTSCPQIRVTIVTKKNQNFTLTSDVVLRNVEVSTPGEPLEDGEF